MARSSSFALLLLALPLLVLGCPDSEETVVPGTGTATGTGSPTSDAGGDANGQDGAGPTDTTGEDGTTSDASGGDAGEDTAIEPVPCTPGQACDDNNPCTYDDRCVNYFCEGTQYVCADGRDCTEDKCDGLGGCEYPIYNGWCLINNVCKEHGEISGANTCERCDTDENKIGWTVRADLEPCENGNPCTFGDYCDDGECKKGLSKTCDDDNECTQDDCNKLTGCQNVPISAPCDDGNPCTATSVCSGGVCVGSAEACDDGSPCTTDTCLPDLGCANVPIEGPCEDGDLCTAGDTCQDGVCIPGPAADCDDGTECTVDLCDPAFGCYQTLEPNPCCAGAIHLCDDGDPCTNDFCDPGTTTCVNELHSGPCEDGNPCTAGDTCQGGVCVSGGLDDCNDGNPCTQDSCNEAIGCQNVPALGACDDGIACTTNDTCLDGQCVGDTSECKCEQDFDTTVTRLSVMQIGDSGQPGQGLDIDDDPTTCSPDVNCSGGIDNSLAPIAGLANPNLVEPLESGELNILLELVNPTMGGGTFEVRLYLADQTGACTPLAGGCDYLVEDDSFKEDCSPLVVLDNATISGGKLTAGGPGYNFPIFVPVFGDAPLELTLYFGRIEGDITINGDQVSITNGLLGGAIPKSVFATALEQVPDAELPIPKEQIVQLIDLLIKDDIDTVPPAGPDAASIGIRFESVPATITGIKD